MLSLTIVLTTSDYVWSTFLPTKLIEEYIQLENKASRDR